MAEQGSCRGGRSLQQARALKGGHPEAHFNLGIAWRVWAGSGAATITLKSYGSNRLYEAKRQFEAISGRKKK